MTRSISTRLGIIAGAMSSDAREAPRLARIAGFRGLLFDVWSSGLNLPELSITGRREFQRIVASQDQQLIGLRMDLEARGFVWGADVDRQIKRLDQAMEAAAGLQSPLLCVDLGPLPQPQAAPKPKSNVSPLNAGLIIIPELSAPAAVEAHILPPDPAFVSQVNAALAEVGQRADRYGVIVAFSSSLASFAAIEYALSAVRCPWFGIDLDPVAILKDQWSRDEVFSHLGLLVRHVRTRDAVAGDNRRTKPAAIGRGDTNWPELLSLLDQAGYSGFLTVDPLEFPDRSAAAMAAVKYLTLVAG